jgi:hypothetical protein
MSSRGRAYPVPVLDLTTLGAEDAVVGPRCGSTVAPGDDGWRL